MSVEAESVDYLSKFWVPTYSAFLAFGFGFLTLFVSKSTSKRARITQLYIERLKEIDNSVSAYWTTPGEDGVILVRDTEDLYSSLTRHLPCVIKNKNKRSSILKLSEELYIKATGGDFQNNDAKPSELTITQCRNLIKEITIGLVL